MGEHRELSLEHWRKWGDDRQDLGDRCGLLLGWYAQYDNFGALLAVW